MVDIANGLAKLSFTEAATSLQPVIVFLVAIAAYSIFIFKFYKFIAKKDIFELHLTKKERKKFWAWTVRVSWYGLKYLLIFPLIAFFSFVILTALLIVLSKNQSVENILLISIALVGSVRIAAYYNEDLSNDLAKMLPFALLGVALLDISFFSVERSLTLIRELPQLWMQMGYYLLFIIILEFILRVSYSVATKIHIKIGPEKKEDQAKS